MDEIEELYLSGIASAKAGNTRLAQAFFKRVIRINPRHAGAWLWLSEVLEDPDDIAYCLEAVLAIDPDNEKARLGLDLVRSRGADPHSPKKPREWSAVADLREMDLPTILAQTPPPGMPVVTAAEVPQKNTVALIRALIFSGAVLLLLVLAVVLTMLPRSQQSPADDAPLPTVDRNALREQQRESIQVYFRQLDALLGPLRLRHDIYRGLDLGPGSLSEGVEQTRLVRDQVAATLESFQKIVPPPVLAEAHQEYLTGLTLESDALQDFMQYYATSQNGYFNRGIVKFQEAESHLERAKAIWSVYREAVGMPEPTPQPTPTTVATQTYGPPPTLTPTFRPYDTATPTPFPTQPIGQ